jgi:hypothetical protein
VTKAALATEVQWELMPSHLPDFVRWVEAIGIFAKKLELHLDELARRQPIPLPDGRVYGPVQVTKERLDGLMTEKVLGELWPELVPHVVQHVHEVKATKGAITVGARAWRPPGRNQTGFVKEVIQALRARGAVYETTHEEVKAHKPKQALEPAPDITRLEAVHLEALALLEGAAAATEPAAEQPPEAE